MEINLKQVIAVCEANYSEKANKYLNLGWILLCSTGGVNADGCPYIKYSLGWLATNGEAKYPETTKLSGGLSL